jgi:hypothetical protein
MFSNIASASLIGLTYFSAIASAAPFSFPLGNGFPNPTPAQVTAIEQQAHGSLPNGGPPPTPKDDTFTSLRLIAFNELTEVAFFTELINNITTNVKDYEIHGDKSKAKILAALNAIVAQEELHLLNANGALSHFNEGPITPCKYNFPVSSLAEAIGLASTFTDVVLGTLQDVATLMGEGMLQSFCYFHTTNTNMPQMETSLSSEVSQALSVKKASKMVSSAITSRRSPALSHSSLPAPATSLSRL